MQNFRRGLSLIVAVVALCLSMQIKTAQAINIGMVNFASTANGGTAVSNPNGSNPQGAIDGIIGDGPSVNTAAWGSNRIGAVWTGTLSPSAPGSTITEIRFYDRSCCTSYAPYTVELLNASNTPIFTDSTTLTAQRPATFTVPNVAGAVKLRVSYTGGAPGDAYVGEIEAIGYNGYVAGANAIGSEVLPSTITGTTTPGNLANAQVVQLTETETTGSVRADFAEFRVFNTSATNVALQSNGGTAYERVDSPPAGFGTQPAMVAATGPNYAGQINDNNIGTFSDSVGYIGDFFAIGLASTNTLSSVQIENRGGCCNGQGNMELQVYSDAARTNLIYDAPVFVSRTPNAITNLQFNLGGTAVSSLENGRTYTMDINAATNLSDLLSVRPLQSTQTQLNIDGNLVVNNLAGTITAGQTFNLFDADIFSGTFDSITLPTLAFGMEWNLTQLYVNGTITAQFVPAPEPSTLLLGAFGVALLAGRARRRRAQGKA